MEDNIKLEVAIEIIADKIARTARVNSNPESEPLKTLLEEKNGMYAGDKDIINKIIKEYGKELKIKRGRN